MATTICARCGKTFTFNYARETNVRFCKDCLEQSHKVIREILMKKTENEITVTDAVKEDVRGYNVGESDYAQHKIQPWDIWIEYKLNPFDADIVKRVLRHKSTDSRKKDYEKIIHICKERIRQIDSGEDKWEE